jgi:hypothetical protein
VEHWGVLIGAPRQVEDPHRPLHTRRIGTGMRRLNLFNGLELGRMTVFHDNEAAVQRIAEDILDSRCHGRGGLPGTDDDDAIKGIERVNASAGMKRFILDPKRPHDRAVRVHGGQSRVKNIKERFSVHSRNYFVMRFKVEGCLYNH